MPPKTSLVVAYIRWNDSAYQRGECNLKELSLPLEMESAGILVREDKSSVSIASDQYSVDDENHWRSITHIPVVNIIEIYRIPISGESVAAS